MSAHLWIGGYAAVFGAVDRAGDVFAPGAFADVQARPTARGAPVLLHAHRGAPVGTITAIEEDGRGLRIRAEITDAAVARLVRCGALRGLSVGYRPLTVRVGARRVLARVALAEVSLVAVPMQALAGVDEVSSEEWV